MRIHQCRRLETTSVLISFECGKDDMQYAQFPEESF